MSKTHLRVVVRLVLLFSLVFALSLTQGWADSIGSTTTARPTLDVATGQVYIFDGDFIPSGDTANTFNWFGPTFSGSKELTPLIFTDNNGVFTVVGIGTAQSVSYTGSAQSFGFGLTSGTATAAGSNYVFGFVSGMVGSDGSVTGGTTGSIGHDNNVTSDPGPGVSGIGTNDWVFTPSLSGLNVGLGETFIIPGSNGTGDFTLNNPGLGGFNVDRTYSANINASSSGVAEPGTFSLITGAGLVLAGLFRYRYSRGRS